MLYQTKFIYASLLGLASIALGAPTSGAMSPAELFGIPSSLLHSQMKILTSHFIGRATSGEYACTCGSRKQQLTSYGATPLDIAIAMLEKYSSSNKKLLFIHLLYDLS
jgi:hypothetical protein